MDSKIPETLAKTDSLNELLTTSDTIGPLLSIHFVVAGLRSAAILACLHHPRIKAHLARESLQMFQTGTFDGIAAYFKTRHWSAVGSSIALYKAFVQSATTQL